MKLFLLIWENELSVDFKNVHIASEGLLFQEGLSRTCKGEFWRLGLMTNMIKAKENYAELQKMKTHHFSRAVLHSFALWVTVYFKSGVVKYW